MLFMNLATKIKMPIRYELLFHGALIALVTMCFFFTN